MNEGKTKRKIAVVLFNLGGPDSPEAVRPFLFNLFRDPAIIGLPGFLRLPLAWLIARRRAKVAAGIYDILGGASPLLENTLAQAKALEEVLWDVGQVRVFTTMRYWHPLADAIAYDVKDWEPDEVVLLPLYPQYSTTTTRSSLRDWKRAATAARLKVPTRAVCCYPDEPGFIDALARLTRWGIAEASAHGRPRVLFSAHGLPEKVVAAGDPYQAHCERTARAMVAALGIPGLDWASCYQSRVGPLKWIGPSTDEEVARAGRDGVPLVVVPIAFVSDHSETLVEIEHEYRDLARREGVPHFVRVPAVGVEASFINGLASLVRGVVAMPPGAGSAITAGCGTGCCQGHRQCLLDPRGGAPSL